MKKTCSALGLILEGTSKNTIEHQLEIVKDLAEVHMKLHKLKTIAQSKAISNVQIYFFSDGELHHIEQGDVPFSLNYELKVLVQESIASLEQDIQTLKNKF